MKRYKEQNPLNVAEYLKAIENVSETRIAYVDETGIDTYLYREYCYTPKGKQVIGRMSGKKYRRTNIVAAKMGKEILAPLQYEGTRVSPAFCVFSKMIQNRAKKCEKGGLAELVRSLANKVTDFEAIVK